MTEQSSAVAALALMLCSALGCGPPEARTYPVAGKVVLKEGDFAQIEGWAVQFQSATAPDTRAIAEIKPGGAFKAVSIINNTGKEGVVEGEHRVCVINVLNADAPGIDRKFKDFNTSGLTVTVPLKGELVVEVTK